VSIARRAVVTALTPLGAEVARNYAIVCSDVHLSQDSGRFHGSSVRFPTVACLFHFPAGHPPLSAVQGA
jgi:hypothetical protein